MVLGSIDAFRWSLIFNHPVFSESMNTVEGMCAFGAGAGDANTIYQPSGERDGVARYESRTGMEIFRSQVLDKDGKVLPAKRWFLGNPKSKKVYYYAQTLETSSTVPPFDEWIVHPETQLEPPPRLTCVQIWSASSDVESALASHIKSSEKNMEHSFRRAVLGRELGTRSRFGAHRPRKVERNVGRGGRQKLLWKYWIMMKVGGPHICSRVVMCHK